MLVKLTLDFPKYVALYKKKWKTNKLRVEVVQGIHKRSGRVSNGILLLELCTCLRSLPTLTHSRTNTNSLPTFSQDRFQTAVSVLMWHRQVANRSSTTLSSDQPIRVPCRIKSIQLEARLRYKYPRPEEEPRHATGTTQPEMRSPSTSKKLQKWPRNRNRSSAPQQTMGWLLRARNELTYEPNKSNTHRCKTDGTGQEDTLDPRSSRWTQARRKDIEIQGLHQQFLTRVCTVGHRQRQEATYTTKQWSTSNPRLERGRPKKYAGYTTLLYIYRTCYYSYTMPYYTNEWTNQQW